MLSYAIMLDGGFVKRKARAAKQAAASQDVVRLTLAIRAHPLLGPHRLHRIYFYDAAPSREVVHNPFSRESIDFGATAAFRENLTLHKKLACEAFFANRLGELSFEGWAPKGGLRKVKDGNVVLTGRDVKPLISQKGVDMRIGLDMASLTLKRLSSLIVLVTRRGGVNRFFYYRNAPSIDNQTVVKANHRIVDIEATSSVLGWAAASGACHGLMSWTVHPERSHV